MRWRGEITTNHKGPFSLERTLREHSLNAFLIRATSQHTHTHTHTHTHVSFFLSDFSVCLPIHHFILLFLICFSDCLIPSFQRCCGCVGPHCLLLCNQRVFKVACVDVCWEGVWPSATLYQRVSLCLCVSSILPSLGRRQHSANTHYITYTHTHTHTQTRAFRAPATTCFVQHSPSSAAGWLSGEVILHNPWDSTCASVCVVIVCCICEVMCVCESLWEHFLLCPRL